MIKTEGRGRAVEQNIAWRPSRDEKRQSELGTRARCGWRGGGVEMIDAKRRGIQKSRRRRKSSASVNLIVESKRAEAAECGARRQTRARMYEAKVERTVVAAAGTR